MSIKRWRKNVRGMTLVELIVTLALMGIFMTAVSLLITSGARMLYRMQSVSNAVVVSELILGKVTGEIAAADVEREGKTTGYYFWIGDHDQGEDWVVFSNPSGNPIAIFADEGRLILRYYAVTEESLVENRIEDLAGEGDWEFEDEAYRGYQISSLIFTRPQPDTHPEVLRVDLTLEHSQTGYVYAAYRYGKNYNFDGVGKRFCLRNDGESCMPSQAAEFTYPAQREEEMN